MNSDKAKEFFSSYRDGTLDRGLRQTLERKLEADPVLKREYEAFVRAFEALDSLSAPVPEPPFDLHDRISARLDRFQWEEKRRAGSSIVGLWKSVLVGGLAVGALFMALMQLDGRGGEPGLATAGIVTGLAPGQLQIVESEGAFELRYRSSGPSVATFSTLEGAVIRTARLDGNLLRSKLENRLPEASIVRFEVDGDAASTLIALPGRAVQNLRAGFGDLPKFAAAVAATLRVPVVVRTPLTAQRVEWNLGTLDGFDDVQAALAKTALTAEQRPGGVIWIQGH